MQYTENVPFVSGHKLGGHITEWLRRRRRFQRRSSVKAAPKIFSALI